MIRMKLLNVPNEIIYFFLLKSINANIKITPTGGGMGGWRIIIFLSFLFNSLNSLKS